MGGERVGPTAVPTVPRVPRVPPLEPGGCVRRVDRRRGRRERLEFQRQRRR